jgi:hypothetical protein
VCHSLIQAIKTSFDLIICLYVDFPIAALQSVHWTSFSSFEMQHVYTFGMGVGDMPMHLVLVLSTLVAKRITLKANVCSLCYVYL